LIERILTSTEATLYANAKRFQPDAELNRIADAMDRGDYASWSAEHPLLQDRASLYRDTRADYREAVKLGLINPGPDAA
jgi:hypothetical protein